MDKALAEGKKRKIARDLYEKKRIYIWSIRLLCVLSQCQRDNQRDFQSEIPTLTFHFEIVFSSLYKFCEGMFRRETVHSHFFVPPSPFRFSVSVSCCPFEAEISFCRNVPLPKALRMGLTPPTLPKTSGRRVRYGMGEREDGAPGLFRQASGGDGGGIMQCVCTEVVGNLRRGRK